MIRWLENIFDPAVRSFWSLGALTWVPKVPLWRRVLLGEGMEERGR